MSAPALSPAALLLLKRADISGWMTFGSADQDAKRELFAARFLEQHPRRIEFYRVTGDGRLHLHGLMRAERDARAAAAPPANVDRRKTVRKKPAARKKPRAKRRAF